MNLKEIIKDIAYMIEYTKETYGRSKKITVLLSYNLYKALQIYYIHLFSMLYSDTEKIEFMGNPVRVVIGQRDDKFEYWISVENREFELSEAGGYEVD